MSYAEDNCAYWSVRAPSYGDVHRREWSSMQRGIWLRALDTRIRASRPALERSAVRVLDVGTGPGFFAMILAQAGYDVTAVDYTPAMLEEARCNAGPLSERIRFIRMDAEHLAFADETFDVVVSRNLTWNLPHPERAYAEWTRVLKSGGTLLNFDANWYRYLRDEAAAAGHAQDRANVARTGVCDDTAGTDVDAMERLANRAPLTACVRPEWDLKTLSRLGMAAVADTEVWRELWTEEELANNASTPLFMLHAEKESGFAA